MTDILFATSFDEKYSPLNVLIANNKVFWTSTGLYPQELIISLNTEKTINSLSVVGYNLKKIVVETCENENAITQSTRQAEINDISYKEGKIQEFSVPFQAAKACKIIRFIVLEGHDDFCSVNTITIK